MERKLRGLELSGMADALSIRNQEAINGHSAFADFLELLVEDKLTERGAGYTPVG